MSEACIIKTVPPRYAACRFDTYLPRNEKQREAKRALYGAVLDEHWLRGGSIILCGPPGVGKTHLAVSSLLEIADDLVFEHVMIEPQASAELVFATHRDLMRRLVEEAGYAERLAKRTLLLVDDLEEPATPREAAALAELIDRRYQRIGHGGVRMIVTTNLTLRELRQALGDRAFDRLAENAIARPVDGASYRTRHGWDGSKAAEKTKPAATEAA